MKKLLCALIAATSIGIQASDFAKKVPADDTEKEIIQKTLAAYKSSHAAFCACHKDKSWWQETWEKHPCSGGRDMTTEDGIQKVVSETVTFHRDAKNQPQATSLKIEYANGFETRINSPFSSEQAIEGRFPAAASAMPKSFVERRAAAAAYWKKAFAAQSPNA